MTPQTIKQVADEIAGAMQRGEIIDGDGNEIVYFAAELMGQYEDRPDDLCPFSVMVGASVYSAIHATL